MVGEIEARLGYGVYPRDKPSQMRHTTRTLVRTHICTHTHTNQIVNIGAIVNIAQLAFVVQHERSRRQLFVGRRWREPEMNGDLMRFGCVQHHLSRSVQLAQTPLCRSVEHCKRGTRWRRQAPTLALTLTTLAVVLAALLAVVSRSEGVEDDADSLQRIDDNPPRTALRSGAIWRRHGRRRWIEWDVTGLRRQNFVALVVGTGAS
jgi:hypothetical protein